jgi:hypothetical protein
MADSASAPAVFKFKDGTTLEIAADLPKLATVLAEKLKEGKKEIDLNERFIGEAFNAFAVKFFPKYAAKLEDLEESVDKAIDYFICT